MKRLTINEKTGKYLDFKGCDDFCVFYHFDSTPGPSPDRCESGEYSHTAITPLELFSNCPLPDAPEPEMVEVEWVKYWSKRFIGPLSLPEVEGEINRLGDQFKEILRGNRQ